MIAKTNFVNGDNRKRFRIISAGICSFSLFSMLFLGCGKDEKNKASVEEILLPVKVIEVQRKPIEEYFSYSGSIDALQRAAIAPSVPARIQKILVEEGQKVGKDQVLVKMDDKQLIQAKAQYISVKRDYERMKILHERGSITDQQFDQIEAGYKAARAGYEMMRESAVLRAPFSGTIIGKHYNEGENFSAMMPGTDGVVAIVSIAKLQMMKIDIRVPEQDFVRIKKGQSVIVEVDALGERKFKGTVRTLNQALDMRSHTARVTVEIRNLQKILKPGMFAKAKIITSRKPSALIVPSQAIVARAGKSFVFTVPSGTPPYRTQPTGIPVTTGMHSMDYTEIFGDLSQGTYVVIENNASLEQNTAVNVVAVASKEGDD